ncbi:uncharacterized protein LOC124689418 [Lolium rigidum]|uniref:uncharacterized protein LOC124689418 n=1 Tax=Lolium rigidum TaxID=89674 RepID=UPI001F5D9841|nr:uncharacterized protein LOC124689418 [Lolium rigidum]
MVVTKDWAGLDLEAAEKTAKLLSRKLQSDGNRCCRYSWPMGPLRTCRVATQSSAVPPCKSQNPPNSTHDTINLREPPAPPHPRFSPAAGAATVSGDSSGRMPSSSLLLPLHLPPLPPRFASSRYPPPLLRAPPRLTPTPRLALPPLRLRAVAARASGEREIRVAEGNGRRAIPIARCYEAGLARLEVAGAARREQAVAAAAAADGGVAAAAHLGAGSEAMVMEAFLPGPGGAASTRVILQAKEVQEKASKIKKDYGDDFFSENEPDSESILAMALKQVVMEKLANFRLEVFSPGSERDFEDWSKPRKVPVDFSISSSDGKLLSALAEAIFSCVIEEIGGPDFVLWAHEFIPSYKLQINAAAFKNTELKGCHELTNNRREVLVSHFQLAELGNVLDMYFEDQFTLPGKTFHSHWNAEPSKIRKNNGYLNNLFAFLAGSSVILIVGVLAQLFWPQSLKDKSLFMGSSCSSSSSQRYCSDVHSLDNSELVYFWNYYPFAMSIRTT